MKKPVSKHVASSTRSASSKKTARKPTAAGSTKNILTAGIQALSNAHGEAVARQSRVFESLLGIGGKRADEPLPEPVPNPLTAALDPFGFRKFEDVFDQRVARALQHLDLPTTTAFMDLQAEVERLRARVTALEASGRKR